MDPRIMAISPLLPNHAILNGVGAGESNLERSCLSLRGPSAVAGAIAAARAFGERAGFADAQLARLAILVEELVINLYDHGELGLDGVLDLEMASVGRDVKLILIAPGREFDPRAKRSRVGNHSQGAGAGLKLVSAWSSRIDHRYVEGRNRLELLVPIAEV
jgi:anti-sigma regulatory factor (Ser/Thr protein kinase)